MKSIQDLNILIIEDDRIFAEVLSRNLARVGLDLSKISIHDSIESVQEDLNNGNPDVVFLDLNIVGSTGLETYYSAAPLFPNSCFIILSGHNDEQLALSCMEAGAQDYISKSDASAYALLKSIQYGLIRKNQLLRESVFYKAFQNSPYPSVITKGINGSIEFVNRAFESMLGEKKNNWVNQKIPIRMNNGEDSIAEGEGVLKKSNGETIQIDITQVCIDAENDYYLYKIVPVEALEKT
jgi:DNA-binding NarL/FixJ family response regulator